MRERIESTDWLIPNHPRPSGCSTVGQLAYSLLTKPPRRSQLFLWICLAEKQTYYTNYKTQLVPNRVIGLKTVNTAEVNEAKQKCYSIIIIIIIPRSSKILMRNKKSRYDPQSVLSTAGKLSFRRIALKRCTNMRLLLLLKTLNSIVHRIIRNSSGLFTNRC